ncbi:SRPBCC family protein [Candidatus Leptofilum sp.]|uniref:SRPBCC family protein n=1 Tax=Candidatus Leptofilum sp. TaxID=3241576 RepID=UPI003B59D36B
MGSFATETTIDAPVTAVWQALSNIGEIHQWNPGVCASHTTSEQTEGVGATRFCDLGGKNYLDEAVVLWQPNEKLTMRITGTNLPFAEGDIRFTLWPEGDQTVVTVSPLYKLKFGVLGELLDRVYVRNNYRQGMDALLAGLKKFVETAE